MKKNKMMRLASILLVCVLLTTSVISGTFAKYTTTTSSQDTAHVAKWGFEPVAMDLTSLFDKVYDGEGDESVKSATDVIAPGTTGSTTFAFKYDETAGAAPEVAYRFTVSTADSEIADSIKNNTNIQWKLDANAWGTWDQLINSIKALSGDASGSKDYAPGNLPTAFDANDTVHTVAWQWIFEDTTDATDTEMGNADELAEVTLKIAITATQLDEFTPAP